MKVNTGEPLVSVVIATHERPIYLMDAINSLLAQTYRNWEAIVVDNGPGLRAKSVVDSLRDARFRYVYQVEGNRSLARNLGVLHAQGEILAFLDDDDRFLPTKLSIQVDELANQPEIGLTACGAIQIDSLGQPITEWRLWELSPELTPKDCILECYLMPSVVMMRRTWFERMKGFAPSLPPAEDTDLFLRLMLAGCRMVWVPSCLCEYRVHDGSSQGAAGKYAQSRWNMIEDLLASPDVAEKLMMAPEEVRYHYAVTGYARCYAAGDFKLGREFLLRALKYRSALRGPDEEHLSEALAQAACQREIRDPYVAVTAGLARLQQDVALRRQTRRRCLAQAAQTSFYREQKDGNRSRLFRSFVQGALCQPTWLVNRGTWSIMAKSLIGPLSRSQPL